MNEFERKMRSRGAVGTRQVWGSALLFAALGFCAMSFAWARIEGTMAGYELSRAQSEHSGLLREQKALQLELATRRATRRIEGDARLRLGLVDPQPERIILIPAGAPADRAGARASR